LHFAPIAEAPVVKWVQRGFSVGFSIITLLFVGCALSLVVLAALELWQGMDPSSQMPVRGRFNAVLESIGLLTIAVASLELGQTILEEEVQREVNTSAPTRVRRFLSRFLLVIIVSLSIEALVAVFRLVHDDPSKLVHASMIAIAAAALLAGWGLFVRSNTEAEKLEPEAMEQTKREDRERERQMQQP
jgi:hypothetical protein